MSAQIKINDETTLPVKQELTLDEIYGICAVLSQPPVAEGDDGEIVYVPSGGLAAYKVAVVKAFIPEIELPTDLTEAWFSISKQNIFSELERVLSDSDLFKDIQTIQKNYSEYHRQNITGLGALNKILSSVNIGEIISGMAENLQGLIPTLTTATDNDN